MNSSSFNFGATLLRSLAFVLTFGSPCYAQEFPTKPLRWLVGFPAGGGTDFLARTVGQKLGQQLGQPVVIDNKPGAAGAIAAEAAAKSPPDGYTVLTADNSILIFNPTLYKGLSYDPARDFASLGLMARFPLILAVHPGSGIASVPELVEAVKKAPGRMSYASPGVGTPHHMAMELIKRRLGLFIVHMPYRGAAPAVQDVVTGHVPMIIVESATGLPMFKSGKLRPLAVVSARRMAVLPGVPTFAELGYKGLEVYAWQGVVVPKATPKAIVDRLSSELQKAVAAPEVRRKLVEYGMEVNPSDATLMEAYTVMETSLWHPLIVARGIRAD